MEHLDETFLSQIIDEKTKNLKTVYASYLKKLYKSDRNMTGLKNLSKYCFEDKHTGLTFGKDVANFKEVGWSGGEVTKATCDIARAGKCFFFSLFKFFSPIPIFISLKCNRRCLVVKRMPCP